MLPGRARALAFRPPGCGRRRDIRYRSSRAEDRSISAVPRKRRLAVKASPVAMGLKHLPHFATGTAGLTPIADAEHHHRVKTVRGMLDQSLRSRAASNISVEPPPGVPA
jgi:hypothetical protein